MLLNQGKLDTGKLRGVMELRSVGIDLSSTSNEVAKMIDALIFQTFAFFDAPEVSGMRGCLEKIASLDPGCPFLRTYNVKYGMNDFEEEVKKLKFDLAQQYEPGRMLDRKWTQFERNQVQAAIYKLDGYDDLSIDIWGRELAKNPLNIMSLSNICSPLINNGRSSEISHFAEYVSRALPKDNIYYPFVRAFEAYGLEEGGQLDLAMKIAKESVNICPWNTWGAHTVAHVYDSLGQATQGRDYLKNSQRQWTPCNLLSCHNNWHIALFELNNNDIEAALEIWDTEIFTRLKDRFSHFFMSDAVALLTRIEMEQYSNVFKTKVFNLSTRWDKLFELISNVIELESPYNFYDAHLALAMMFCGKRNMLDKMCERTEEWVSRYENKVNEVWESNSVPTTHYMAGLPQNRNTTRRHVLLPLLKALAYFRDGEYQSAVNVLYPVRYQFKNIGGSRAQNDLFHQILAMMLLMAGGEENKANLKMLLFEREDQGTMDNYGERMRRKIVHSH